MTHRSRRAFTLLVGLAIVAGVAACGDDPIAPRDIAGTYVYVGRWPVFPTAADYAEAPRNDTIVFLADGSGRQIQHVVLRLSSTGIPEMHRVISPLLYRVKGRTIYVSYADPMLYPSVLGARDAGAAAGPGLPDAPRFTSMTPGPHFKGTLTTRGLLLTSAYSAGDTLAYARVFPLSP